MCQVCFQNVEIKTKNIFEFEGKSCSIGDKQEVCKICKFHAHEACLTLDENICDACSFRAKTKIESPRMCIICY